MKTDIKIIEYGSPDWEKAVELRENILRKPLGSHFSADELEEERNHLQVAGFIDDKLIATAALVPEGKFLKMQRVVVSDDLRNLGTGTQMMIFCEEIARSKRNQRLYCHAKDTAVNFYLKNGYSPEGNYFDEDGIPHIKMYKSITS